MLLLPPPNPPGPGNPPGPPNPPRAAAACRILLTMAFVPVCEFANSWLITSAVVVATAYFRIMTLIVAISEMEVSSASMI